MFPELGFSEFRTASKIVEILASLRYEVLYGKDAIDSKSRWAVPSDQELEKAYNLAINNGANPNVIKEMKDGDTAVIGILEGKSDGPTVAFRFDMDALPIQECKEYDHVPTKLGFQSKTNGMMHACGHDGHTAIGLALASQLSDRNFAGTVKLIFQPAEEGGRGANAIVQKGLLDDVDDLFCLHVGMGFPFGTIHGGFADFLGTVLMEAKFHGVPSHAGARPEQGHNALLGAATALLNIHSISRFSSGTTRINVGLLEGGTAVNIVPSFARMLIDARSNKAEIIKELKSRIETIISSSAAMHGLTYELEIIGEGGTAVPDPELVSLVLEEARTVEGFNCFLDKAGGSVGGEDATFMIRRVQEHGGKGTYMLIGSTLPAPHHHHRFDFDEEILPMSVQLLTKVAKRMLV
jgi:aminobenzoyl-glutamate utilization protein A